ncbi:MAG: Cys-Gln thioester bond-forming surface protein [Oscillospiraceae bacterium]|nr:Cys-Gln thioester bond-forming surface protein [Oscillospiraceae bacterium]
MTGFKRTPGRRRAAAALLFLALLLGIAPTALAADIDPAAVVHSVNYSYPVSGDSNPDNWGRPELYFLGGWFTGASDVWWVHSFTEADNVVAYCIEPGAARDDNTVDYTSRGEDYWQSFVNGTSGTHGSVLNPTIDGATIRKLIGRVMEYGYQGEISTSWKSQNAADADRLADQIATQILIWETIVGERDAGFEHVDPSGTGTYRDGSRTFTHARNAVLEYVSADHPLRPRILAHYDRIVSEVKKNEILPSFMASGAESAQTIDLQWNGSAAWADGKYTVTLTDTNNVLSDFTFSGTGLTFSVSGNKLTITSDSPITSAVTITATTTRKTNSFITWSDGKVGFNVRSKQDVVTYGTSVTDTAKACLKVRAPTTGITVNKQSDDGKVSGIFFTLKYGTDTVATKSTDSAGTASFTGLPVGATFTLAENVPDGYAAEVTAQNVTTTAGTANVTFKNHKIVSLDIIKTADDGNVSGIPFTVKEGNSTIFTGQTDSNGKLNIPDLRIGQVLTVTETVPEGYTAENETQTITLTAGTNTVTFVNHLNTVPLDLIKQSDDGNVSGISFQVEKAEGNSWTMLGTFVTDGDGRLSVPDLTAGTKLRITETVPEYYRAEAPSQEITVTKDSHTVTFVNHPYADLEIIKTSGDGNVGGISFRLIQISPEEKDLGAYETDADGRIAVTGLEAGAAVRVTEEIPEGYVPEEPEKELTLVRGRNSVSFANRQITGGLKISKTTRLSDSDRVPVEGTVYAVYDPGHNKVAEAATDGNGEVCFEGLPYGDYTYKEILAPEGFEPDGTEYSFSIREDGETVTEERENDRKRGSISVFKTDENGTALPGVVFELDYSLDDGETWQPVQSVSDPGFTQAGCCSSEGLTDGRLTTGEDGLAVFEGLAVSTPVQTVLYRVTEIRTKDGYSLLAGPVFEGELTAPDAAELSFTAVNYPVFTLPRTGGGGFAGICIAVCLGCMSAALVLQTILPDRIRASRERRTEK